MKISKFALTAPPKPNWGLSQIITPPTTISGFSNRVIRVSGDSNYLAVSARFGDLSTTNYGSVFIYIWNTVTNEFDFQTQLFPPVSASGDNFGNNISIDNTGTRIAIADSISGTAGDSVYIYSRSGTTWSLEQTITDADLPGVKYIISPMGLDGTGSTLALNYNDSGTFGGYIFDRSGTTWTIGQQLSSAAGPFSPYQFSNNGDYLLIETSGFVGGEIWFRTGGVYSLQSTITGIAGLTINGNGDNVIGNQVVSFSGPIQQNVREIVNNYQRTGTTWTLASPQIEHPEWNGSAASWYNGIRWIVTSGGNPVQNDDSTEVIFPEMTVGPAPPQSLGSGYQDYVVAGFGLLSRQTSIASLEYNNFTRKPDYERPTPLLNNTTPAGPNAAYTGADMSNNGYILALANYNDNLNAPAGSTGCVYIYSINTILITQSTSCEIAGR
jgi:hypothetical protein